MSDLEFTGGLDLSDALASVDDLSNAIASQVGDALSSAFDSFTAAGTDAIAEIAGSTAEIPITADVSAAEAEVAGLVSTADGETATISVEADTGDAAAQVDDLTTATDGLSTSAKDATGATGGLKDNTSALAGIAGLATGQVSGLKTASGELGGSAAVAAGGAFALAGGLGALFKAGLDAISAEQRFNALLGDSAKAVLDVRVGDLTANVYDLGAKFGSTEAAMQNAVATIYQHADAAGFAAAKSRTYTDELVAMGARAVATNPAIGNLGDVVTSLETKFGRSRGLVQYGISLSQADINNRALQESGKATAIDLTVQDKAYAGLALAVEKYGNGLSEKIATGAENAANKEKALKVEFDNFLESAGKPLVAPAFDVMKAAIPVGEELASTLSDVGSVAIPVVAEALKIIGPLIGPVVEGFLAMKAAELAAAGVGLLADGMFALGTILPVAGAAATAAGAEIAAAETTISAAAGPIGILVAGLAFAATQFGIFGDGGKSAAQAAKDFSDQLTKTSDAALLGTFNRSIDDAAVKLGTLGNSTTQSQLSLRLFRQVAEDNVGTAQRLLDAQGPLTPMGQQYAAILDQVRVKQQQEAAAKNESKVAADALNSSTNDSTVALTQEANALKGLQDTVLAGVGGQIGYQQSIINVQKAQAALNDAVNQYGPDSSQARDAQLSLASAQNQAAGATLGLDQAQAALQAKYADSKSVDKAIADLKQQQAEYPATADSLNPLIYSLLTLKAKYDAIPPVVNTVLHVNDADALAAIARVTAGLNGLPANVITTVKVQPGTLGFAEGGYIAARPGGTQVTVGEGGNDEVIVSPANIPGAIANLERAGILDQLLQRAVYPAPSGPSATSAPDAAAAAAAARSSGGLTIENATFGTTDVIPALDYFAQTRMAGV